MAPPLAAVRDFPARPHGHELLRVADDGLSDNRVCRVCLWGVNNLATSRDGLTSSIWDLLAGFLPRTTFKSLIKVLPIRQPDGVPRVDLYVVGQKRADRLIRFIQRRAPTSWYARDHRSFVERNLRGVRGGTSSLRPCTTPPTGAANLPGASISFLVLSYNVNALRSKRTQLREYVGQLTRRRLSKPPDVVALQETMILPGQLSFRMRGYQTIHQPVDNRKRGSRGLTLCVRLGHACQVLCSSDWFQIIRVVPREQHNPLILVNLYLPHHANTRQRAIAKLRSHSALDPSGPPFRLVIVGDFNLSGDEAVSFLRRAGTPGPELNLVLRRDGTPIRVTRTGMSSDGWHTSSAIDHCLASPGVAEQSFVTTLKGWDLSDHWPLLSNLILPVQHATRHRDRVRRHKFYLGSLEAPSDQQAADPSTWSDTYTKIVTSNRFAALAAELEEPVELAAVAGPPVGVAHVVGAISQDRLDSAARRWEGAVKSTFRSQNLFCPVRRRRHGPRLSKRLRKRLRRRQKMYKAIRKTPAGTQARREATEAWQTEKEETNLELKAEQRKAWMQRMEVLRANMRNGDSKTTWQTIRALAYTQSVVGKGIQPLLDPETGQLALDTDRICELWRDHFVRLHGDATGHSRSSTFWENTFGSASEESRDRMKDLNRPFEIDELRRALASLKTGKAPGEDEIPAEVFKILTTTVEGTAMGKAMLVLLNRVYACGKIPESWQCSILVPIFKQKGEVSDPGNYRGIALMNTTLKILCVMLNVRLTTTFEELGYISPHQAGFRQKEEAVAQAAALVEILMRRRNAKKETWALFVDLEKAYDTVPHEALFHKLSDKYGVHGEALAFLRALYSSSKLRVRIGTGETAVFTDPIPVLRGVRQGCVLSPFLFNIFINDLFEEVERLRGGVTVPGCEQKIPGLMFADDLVQLGEGEGSMVQANACLLRWLQKHEMRLNVSKCGLMRFGGVGPLAESQSNSACWILQGQRVPVVSCYNYLGVQLNWELDQDTMCLGRLAMAKKAFRGMFHFLTMTSIPLTLRLMPLRAVLIPQMLYGTEVHGGSSARLKSAQVLVNRCLRLCMGVTGRGGLVSGGMSSHTLWRELGVPPLVAQAAGRRVRLLTKAPELKTHLKTLVLNTSELGSGGRWTRQSKVIRTKFARRAGLTVAEINDLSPRRAYHLVHQEVWKGLESKVLTKPGVNSRFKRYHLSRFRFQSVLGLEYAGTTMALALRQFIQMRIGVWWSGEMLAVRGLLNPEFRSKCPCCRQHDTPETMEHAVLYCPKWEDLREQFFEPVVEDLMVVIGDPWDHGMGINGEDVDIRQEDFRQMVGLLGGQSGMGSLNFRDAMDPGALALGFTAAPRVDDLRATQARVVDAMLCFLQALTLQRGPIISALISTESRRRTGRARRPREQPMLPWVDFT